MNAFRRTSSALSRVRNFFDSGDRRQPRAKRARRRPLTLEALEDRVVLDVQGLDLGGLHFQGDFLLQPNHTYTSSGIVQLGLTPPSGEEFTPLIYINPEPGSDANVVLAAQPVNTQFTVAEADFEAVIEGAPTPILWKTDSAVPLDAAALSSGGVNLPTGGHPFNVGTSDFTLRNLRFANPDGGSTTDSQIKLQGILTALPLIGLNLAVEDENFVIIDSTRTTVTGVSPAVSGSLSVGGLGFDIKDLSASYNDGVFSLTGSTTFQVEGESVTADFVTPGLQVSGGELLHLNLAVSGNLKVGGLSFKADNLRGNYTESTQTIAITGSASCMVDGQSLTVSFAGGGTNGLLIQDGTLESLDVSFKGSFNLLDLQFQVGTDSNPLRITYDRGQDQYTMSGTVSVPELFGVSVTLGTATVPGIVIQNGHFSLNDLTLHLGGVPLGGFTLGDLTVAYSPTTFTVDCNVWFPGGWKVHGLVGFDHGQLNTLGLGLQTGQEGIEIADTGVMITAISGEVQNLQHPANLIVSGSMTAVWGSASIIEVTGGFLVDRNELVLTGDVSFLDGLGSGDVRLTLDWGAQDYDLDVHVGWWDDTFEFDARIDISDGDDLYVRAKAAVNVPTLVPFIGGHTLADINFVLEYHGGDPNLAHSFVAAWVDVDLFFFSFDIGLKVDFTGNPSVIGSNDVNKFKSPPPDEKPRIYTYTIPVTVLPNYTNAGLRVEWPEAKGTQSVAVIFPDHTKYDQSQFPTNNLTLVSQLSSRQSIMVGMAGSSQDEYVALTPGTYQLVLTSDYKFSDTPTLSTSFGNARPTATKPALHQPTPTSLEVEVELGGNMVNSLGSNATVSLFVDGDNMGYDGSPVPGATNVPVTVDAQGSWVPATPVTWSLDGLLPLDYYVYAAINDGLNGTVYSDYSAAVKPDPPLWGAVNDVNNHVGIDGLTVYIDRDNNGQFDPNHDPYTTTDNDGFYSFDQFDVSLTPFFVGVVIPPGYQLHPGSINPVQVQAGDTPPYNIGFTVDEFAAIHGQVCAEFAAGAQPLGGWLVYLDANNDGQFNPGEISTLTATDGTYAFHNLLLHTTDTVLSTTQIVRVQLPIGYYQTKPASPGSYTVHIDDDMPFKIYSGNNFGVLPFSSVSGSVYGYPLQLGYLLPNSSLAPNAMSQQSWGVNLLAAATAIDAGGGATGDYLADQGASGGQVLPSNPTAIDTSRVADPAPQEVYQTNRYGLDFSYAVTGRTPNAAHEVRLHFAETFWTTPGRVFNVAINGQMVLSNYDIFVAAGGDYTAVIESFNAVADASGTITIHFTAVSDNAQINGIEVSEVIRTTTTDQSGNYRFVGLPAGTYRVEEVPPAGWRQIAPFVSDLQLQVPGADDVFHVPGNVPPGNVAVADFDGDGKLDVAVLAADLQGHHGVVWVFYNGQWTAPVGLSLEYGTDYYVLVVGDFYGTGRIDIGALGLTEERFHARVDVLPNVAHSRVNNFGTVVEQWSLPDYEKGYVGDLVVLPADQGSSSDRLVVFYYNQQGQGTLVTFSYDSKGAHDPTNSISGAAWPQQMVAADVNDDGYNDLVISDVSRNVYVDFGGAGGFTDGQSITGLPAGSRVLAADFTGDGLIDLGVFDYTNQFHHAIQDQAGNFTAYSPGVGFEGPGTIRSAFFQDVNGDLLPDLVWVVDGTDALYVVLNSGPLATLNAKSAWFSPDQLSIWGLGSGGQGPLQMAPGDINGDGLADLVVTDGDAHTVKIVYNRSVTSLAPIDVTVDGDDSTGNNFFNAQVGQINGRVFVDADRNGREQPTEPGRAGALVYVDLDQDGQYDANEPAAVTVAGGFYAIDGLAAGTYSLRVAPQGDWRSTNSGPEFVEVVVDGQSTVEASFGSARRLIQSLADQYLTAGEAFALPVVLSDVAAEQQLVFSLDPGAPSGLAIDPGTGLLTWTPSADQGPGTYLVEVRVRDPLAPTSTEVEPVTLHVSTGDDYVFYVRALYRDVLGRDPEQAGLDNWVDVLHAGVSRPQVAQAVWDSVEHRGVQVDEYYDNYLHREPDALGWTFWVNALQGGLSEGDVIRGFLTSQEYLQAHPDTAAYLTGLYADVLGRLPDAAGLAAWEQAAADGVSPATLADAFLHSPETETNLVDRCYADYLGRAGDSAGVETWLAALQADRLSWAGLAEAFLASDEFFAQAT